MRKIFDTVYDFMSTVFDFLAIMFVFGGAITLYTLIASTSSGRPFPAWFEAAWVIYAAAVVLAILVGLVCLVRWICKRFVISRKVWRVKNRRRLGMVRMDQRTGRFYYEGREVR